MIKKTLPKLILGLSLSMGAYAQEGIEIYGFASFAAGKTFNEETLPNGEDTIFGPSDRVIYTDEVAYRPESTIGIQIDASLDDGLMLKTLLQADGEKDYSAEMKWAYAEYELAEGLKLQAGRQPLPLFFYTDFIDVGYSYQWVRPPLETYYIKNSTFDGTQLRYDLAVGDYEYRLQAYHGRDKEESDLTLDLNSITGVVAYMRKDWLEIRATAMETKIETGLQGLDFNTGQLVPLGDTETKATYVGAAIKATFRSSYITAEWVKDDEEDPIQEFAFLEGTEAWYVSAGYGVEDLVPYITYAESENKYSSESPLLLENSSVKSTSWTTGIRWDFHSSAALKLEYTTRKDNTDDAIVDVAGKVKEVDALTAAIDLVF